MNRIGSRYGWLSYGKETPLAAAKLHLQEFQTSKEDDVEVPVDPQQFYETLGLLEHPKTRIPVLGLAPYQISTWLDGFRYKYRLTVKSQKVGLSTSALMEDFQRAILPITHPLSCRGREILVISQSLKFAEDHLRTLRHMIMASNRYRHLLIDRPTEVLLRDEVTKVTAIYIKNPDNAFMPTRIIGLGPKEGMVWSWKNVKHIHMSDVAASNQIDDSGLFGAAFSRLANTQGTMHIETPPRGQRGQVWAIYEASQRKDPASIMGSFKINHIYAREAVAAGLILQEFLDSERVRLGPLYGQYYECEFVNPYTTWYEEKFFKYSDKLAQEVD